MNLEFQVLNTPASPGITGVHNYNQIYFLKDMYVILNRGKNGSVDVVHHSDNI